MTNTRITNRKVKFSINVAAYATMLIAFFWGLYFMAPSPVKAIFSLGMWVSILCIPRVLVKHNDFSKITNWLLRGLLLMAIIEIVRTVFNADASMYAFGDKWLTLFGNEYTALLLLAPIFVYLGTLDSSVLTLKNTTWVYLLLGAIFTVAMKMPLAILVIFVMALYPYVNKKYKVLIGMAAMESILKATTGENPSRMLLIVLAFALASYLLVYVVRREKLLKTFVIVFAVSPLLLFVPMLMSTPDEKSFFQEAQSYIMEETADEDMANDTRTFLYLEMAEDLTESNSWIIGKGAFSHYYSAFFDQDSHGRFGRISSEVPLLNYLLRGGIVYVILYFGLILLAVYKAIWKGHNKFVQSIGIIAIGWYFNSFVGDITGCRFYHVAFFLLLGCCLSERWLNYTDDDVKRILCRR